MSALQPEEFRWSVTLIAEGERTMGLDEIVELADAIAAFEGVATGIGQQAYGAQIVVTGAARDEALANATGLFLAAARAAGLPDWPVSSTSAVGEHEEEIAEADQWL